MIHATCTDLGRAGRGRAGLRVALPAALLAALLAAACGGEPRSFRIALSFDSDERHGCDPAGCGEYALEESCSVKLGIRIENLATGRVVSECRAVAPAGRTMCSLTTVSVSLGQVPIGMSRLSVAVWNPSQLAPLGGECPAEDIFDLDAAGVPRVDATPRPAFGGAIYFDVGAEPVAQVPLACTVTRDVVTGECPVTALDVTVRDLASGQPIDDATDMAVSFVKPRPAVDEGTVEVDAPDETAEWTFDDAAALAPRDPEAPEAWAGAVEPLSGGVVCAEVDRDAGRNAAALTCHQLPGGGTLDALAIDAWELDSATLDALLEAAGMQDPEFEARGLVVGRVVADDMSPVSGVTVAVTGGTVGYLPDVPGTAPAATEQNGYFFSDDVPFGEGQWSARWGDPQREAAGLLIAGLISGKVSVQVIRVDSAGEERSPRRSKPAESNDKDSAGEERSPRRSKPAESNDKDSAGEERSPRRSKPAESCCIPPR